MKRWEYKCIRVSHDNSVLEKELNELGSQGWELMGTTQIHSNFSSHNPTILIFKKEKEE